MIIAEIGLNHMGSLETGLEYVDVLKDTDVDGITFQIREKEYYERKEKSMFKLHEEDYYALRVQIKNAGKKFGIAIADVDYIDYLENIGVDFYKIIRNDITNKELTEKLISTGKKIIVSTGLSSDEDIDLFMEKYGKKGINGENKDGSKNYFLYLMHALNNIFFN